MEIRQTKRNVKTELRCRCKTKAPAEKEMREKNKGEKSQPQQSEKPERIHSIPFKTQPATQGKLSHIYPPD